jgi:alpha-beta hydrolase superfamily lysophospholipase
MQPLPGASLRFLSLKAIDGFRVQAALWQPENKPPADTTVIVQVHGSGGNLSSLPLRAIARALSAEGYAALSISTRQHDEHVNTDNFFDVRRDIEAAVATVRALGYRSIVLLGHSLGTIQVAFYAATDWHPTIKAVILTGAFGKLPWKSRHILIQDEDNYRALADASLGALNAGKAAEILPIKMRWLGGVETPVTAQHFLTYRDEQTRSAGISRGCLVSRANWSYSKVRPTPVPLQQDTSCGQFDWADRQQALCWELRTATSLARLRKDQDRVAEAREPRARVS